MSTQREVPPRRGLAQWPLVRWTSYGRWSDDGSVVYASTPVVAKYGYEMVIYRAADSVDARRGR